MSDDMSSGLGGGGDDRADETAMVEAGAVVTEAPARERFRHLHQEQPDQKVWCPTDDWFFRPRYTDGVCPLCGWRPAGLLAEPPRWTHIDWFWPSVGLLLAVSVLMGVLVVIAYNRA